MPESPLLLTHTPPPHPYITSETRLIALTRALRHLRTPDLALAEARFAAYAAAGLAPVTAGEDEEARRRSEVYWRRVVPAAAAAAVALAAPRVVAAHARTPEPADA